MLRLSAALLSRPVLRHATAPVCSSVGAASSTISLFFERPIRALLTTAGPRRKIELDLTSGGRPLQSVQAALEERLPPEAVSIVALRHGKRLVSSDEDLRTVLGLTQRAGASLQLRVTATEGAESALEALAPPPGAGEGLQHAGAAAAVAHEPHQMLSFYQFCTPPLAEGRLPLLRLSFLAALGDAAALGSVYLAREGINGQVAVPCSQLSTLRSALARIPEMSNVELNIGKVEPAGSGRGAFRRLVVKQREQVLTDGLKRPLDWDAAGRELTPEEWHLRLSTARKATTQATDDGSGRAADGDSAQVSPRPVLLDCRNEYESEVGTFEGVAPLHPHHSIPSPPLTSIPIPIPILILILIHITTLIAICSLNSSHHMSPHHTPHPIPASRSYPAPFHPIPSTPSHPLDPILSPISHLPSHIAHRPSPIAHHSQ